MADAAALSRVGQVIAGKYRLLRVLVHCGMGEVYEAANVAVRRLVALKLHRPKFALRAEMVMRFEREARASGAIHVARRGTGRRPEPFRAAHP